MKKLIYIVIIFLTLSSIPLAKQYLCMTKWNPGKIRFYDIPGPGYHPDGLIARRIINIPVGIRGLTFDGDNFWLCLDSTVYCFDVEGNLVNDFPNPYPNAGGLGWDGEYLWMAEDGHVYQVDTDGNPGPYPGFTVPYGDGAIAVIPDDSTILAGFSGGYGVNYWCGLASYDYNGNPLGDEYYAGGEPYYYYGSVGLAFDGEYIWYLYNEVYEDWPKSGPLQYESWNYLVGINYNPGGYWSTYSTVYLDQNGGHITICDHDFINIAEKSLGRIKAYFAEKGE